MKFLDNINQEIDVKQEDLEEMEKQLFENTPDTPEAVVVVAVGVVVVVGGGTVVVVQYCSTVVVVSVRRNVATLETYIRILYLCQLEISNSVSATLVALIAMSTRVFILKKISTQYALIEDHTLIDFGEKNPDNILEAAISNYYS